MVNNKSTFSPFGIVYKKSWATFCSHVVNYNVCDSLSWVIICYEKTFPFNFLFSVCALAHWITTWTVFSSLDQSLLKRIKASILKKERRIAITHISYLSSIYLSSVHLSSHVSNRYCLFLCFHLEEQFINGKTKVEPLLLELEAFLQSTDADLLLDYTAFSH